MLSLQQLWWVVMLVAVLAEEQSGGDQEVAIIKQINRVNDDGTYTFGYEAADGSFKIETRDVLGNVKGMFGFIDETGELKRVSYTASNGTGFQRTGTGPAGRRPILVLRNPSSTTTRAPVIQHIPPRRHPTTTTTPRAESNTTPIGEYGRRESSTRSGGGLSTTTEEPHRGVRLVVTKRPLQFEEPKGANLIRRQLPQDFEQSYQQRRLFLDPRDVYRNMLLEQNDLKPEVPRYLVNEDYRPEVPAVVPMVDRLLGSRFSPSRVPYRYRQFVEPSVAYSSPGLARLPPQRVYDDYDRPLDLEALRDEIMNYLIQYLQYRARRVNPYYQPAYFQRVPSPALGGGDQAEAYYQQRAAFLPPPPPPPPQSAAFPPGAGFYYPRNLPVTPSPNIQYSEPPTSQGRYQTQSSSAPSPLIRMLLAAPGSQRPPAVRSVEILGTAATSSPILRSSSTEETVSSTSSTTVEPTDEMEASS